MLPLTIIIFIQKRRKQEKEIQGLRQEIEILKKIYHENVIQFLDSFESPNEFCLVTELAQGQLYDILEEDKKLPENEIKGIARQLVAGLNYLHSSNIIHRDIKPQNILISANGIIKICDFGFARAIENKTMIRSIKGTPLYMAPELLKESPYNHKADLWSLGVIIYELYVGQPPFYTNSFPTLINKINNENIKYPDSMSSQFKDLLKGLLSKNPKDRFDWNRIIDHQFLKETDIDKNQRLQLKENYKKWILRLNNEKVFNLYESTAFMAKFSEDLKNIEKNIENLNLENSDKTIKKSENNNNNNNNNNNTFITGTNLVNNTNRNQENINTDIDMAYWENIDSKITNEEYATNIRKDMLFSNNMKSALELLIIKDDNIHNNNNNNNKYFSILIKDKKLLSYLIRILFNALTKGKFQDQNLDVSKNQDILELALSIFINCLKEDDQILLNYTIKVIGLFSKFYCYYSNYVDLSFCSYFIKYLDNILNLTNKPSSVQINMIKAVGIMITAANMFLKRSLLFYKTFIECNIVSCLFNIIKQHKNVPNNLAFVKSAVECLSILIHPMNGEIVNLPLFRLEPDKILLENSNNNNYMLNIVDQYNEYKPSFELINIIKKSFLVNFIDLGINDILVVLFEIDNETNFKVNILKIFLQLIRNFPQEMLIYIKSKGVYIGLINNIFLKDDTESKNILQTAYLLLIEIVKTLNNYKINSIEQGYDVIKPSSLIEKSNTIDAISLALSFGLLAECLHIENSYKFINQISSINSKYIKSIKELVKSVQTKGKEETKKLEGTNFGFLKCTILDYCLIYLERLFVRYNFMH